MIYTWYNYISPSDEVDYFDFIIETESMATHQNPQSEEEAEEIYDFRSP